MSVNCHEIMSMCDYYYFFNGSMCMSGIDLGFIIFLCDVAFNAVIWNVCV